MTTWHHLDPQKENVFYCFYCRDTLGMSSGRNKVRQYMKIPTLRKGQEAIIQPAWSTQALRDLANRNLNQPEKCNLEILQILIVLN